MTGTDPATRARAYARDLDELPDRIEKLADESDLVIVRRGLAREVCITIRAAMTKKRTFYKDGEAFEYDEPDFSAVMKGYEMLGRWLLLDPDELIERSEKVRRAFERGRKAA